MHEAGDMSEEEFQKSVQLIDVFTYGARLNQKYFSVSLKAAEKFAKYAETQSSISTIIFDKLFPLIKGNKALPNQMILHNTKYETKKYLLKS